MALGQDENAAPWPDQIRVPYLMVLNLALTRHEGRYWADPLWAKDLLLHRKYIPDLTLFCPIRDEKPPADWVAIEGINIVSAGPPGHRLYPAAPMLAARLWHAIGRAELVHVGLGGWPYPMGWLATPIARLRRRFLMTIIESSFWRVPPGASLLKRTKAAIIERLNKVCVNLCDLALFTTSEYRDSLATSPRGQTYITPATWVDASQLLSIPAAQEKWRQKSGRFLFAGRLTEQKGITDLIQAVRLTRCQVDIVGSGDLIDLCRSAASELPEQIRVLPPVSYGDDFSALLDDYSALILPTRSDEQPRVMFDAFARAIPVIASSTSANVELIQQSGAGTLFKAADAASLAEAMENALADPARLEQLGLQGLDFAAARTHAAMHRHRAALILEVMRSSSRSRAA